MALRYAHGPCGWGLTPFGQYRTPQELGRCLGYQEKGYDQLNFLRYQTGASQFTSWGDWTPGSLETKVRYSRDPLGNYYMDPNGRYCSTGILQTREQSIKSACRLDTYSRYREAHVDRGE